MWAFIAAIRAVIAGRHFSGVGVINAALLVSDAKRLIRLGAVLNASYPCTAISVEFDLV